LKLLRASRARDGASAAKARRAIVCCAVALLPLAARAGDAISVSGALEDAKLYFTSPVRWDGDDWIAFAGSLAAIGASMQFDSKVRTHFATGSNALNGGQDPNSLRDAAPTLAIVGGTWLYAGWLRDSDGYRETWALFEAGVFSTVTGETLKYAAGRERPNVTTSPHEWFVGGDSFPSVHVSGAFAVGTVFAEEGNDEYRWVRRIIGYGVGLGTAYARIHDNVHWLSDTVAGGALGIATARFVLNRQEAQNNRSSVRIEPLKDGWSISYSVRFQ
jgi:membrane-associated phospholipid phosphatase